jgi:hypothetical protein
MTIGKREHRNIKSVDHTHYQKVTPNPQRLIEEQVGAD